MLCCITERYLPLEDVLKDVMEKELEVIIMEEKLVITNTTLSLLLPYIG